MEKLETTNIADALDTLGMNKFAYGIAPMNANARKIIGKAVTVKVTAAGMTKSKTHMCIKAIDAAQEGDVIVIDNGGRLDTNYWGGLTALAAKLKGVAGAVIDGVCRDVKVVMDLDYPIYTKGYYMVTGKDRVQFESVNQPVTVSDLQVCPGDLIMWDDNGALRIPKEKAEEVLQIAQEIETKEDGILAALKVGSALAEARRQSGYHHLQSKRG